MSTPMPYESHLDLGDEAESRTYRNRGEKIKRQTGEEGMYNSIQDAAYAHN